MAIARVGSVAKGDTAGVAASAVAATWGATTTAGNFLVAIVQTRAIGLNTPTFTAPAGWVAAPPSRAGATGGANQDPSCQIWYIANCGARSGSESFSWTGSAEAILYLAEYSGVATVSPYDTEGNAASSTTATNVQTGTTAALTSSNSLCVASAAVKNQTRTLSTPQNGYTLVRSDSTTDGTAANGITTGYLELIGGTAGSTTTTGVTVNTLSQHTAVLAVFKPAGSGTTYTDTASGTITLSGSATDASVRVDAVSGTVTLSGTKTDASVRTDARAGSVTLTGSRVEAVVFANTAAGTFTLTGSRVEASIRADAATGTVTLTGSRTESSTRADTRSGSVVFTGSQVEAVVFANTAAGTFTLGGTAAESHTAATVIVAVHVEVVDRPATPVGISTAPRVVVRIEDRDAVAATIADSPAVLLTTRDQPSPDAAATDRS